MAVKIFFAYVILLNLIGYCSMGYDKGLAKRHERRVPEKRLFAIAYLGGALGSYLGMQQFRHKTKHLSFRVLIPLGIVWNLFAYVAIYRLVSAFS